MAMPADQTITRECRKCAGRGYISAYAGIAGGVCFSCNGHGYITTTRRKEQVREAAAKRERARRSKRTEEHAQRLAEADKAAGLTAEEHHDNMCLCRSYTTCIAYDRIEAIWAQDTKDHA